MIETPKSATKFAIPKEGKEPSEPQGYSPAEVGKFIRYCLSELAGTNSHHEFEQMCFQLARKRIYPNIIPSTGPVSAGGDQGSDFESYEVGADGGPFFGQASEGKVVFACSIEKNVKKNIRKDLDVIANANASAKTVVFFSNQPVPVGVRHKLQEHAKATSGIDFELFDLFAISELLADPEVFWIATRFLSIPSEMFLASTEKKVDWYQETLSLQVDAERLTSDEFVRIKRAIRYATFRETRHSDLPGFFQQMRLFRGSKSLGISRRAFYEESVASLRGPEFVDDCIAGLREYFVIVWGT